jgi:hypothetical protein
MASKRRKKQYTKSLEDAATESTERQARHSKKGEKASSSYSDDWPTDTSANAMCQPPTSEERMGKKQYKKGIGNCKCPRRIEQNGNKEMVHEIKDRSRMGEEDNKEGVL